MRRWVAVAVAVLMCAVGAMAQVDVDGLTVTSLVEEIHETLGWVTLKGQVRNDGSQIVRYPQIIFTLKKDGRVVAVQSDNLETPADNLLAPGEIGFFEQALLGERDFYDALTYRCQGRPDALDPAFLSGDLMLLEDTLNLIEYAGDAAVAGEFVNNSNAVIGDVTLRFTLYDAAGNALGYAEPYSFNLPDEIRPGVAIGFVAGSDASLEDVATWEASWDFVPLRLARDTVTAVPVHSWGEVKAAW